MPADTVVDLADIDPDCTVFKELCHLYEEQQVLSDELSDQIEMLTVTRGNVAYGKTYTIAKLYIGRREQTRVALCVNLWGVLVHQAAFHSCSGELKVNFLL